MTPVTIPGGFVAKAEGCADLPLLRGADGALYSAWLPTPEERARIAAGDPVVLGVWAERTPPVTVLVGAESIPVAVTA